MEKVNAIVIEDKDLIQILKPLNKLFRHRIEILGCAKSLEEGVSLFLEWENEIDLVFLDYFLDESESEEISALALIQQVKMIQGKFSYPVILVTNFAKRARKMASNSKEFDFIIGFIIKDLYLGMTFEEQLENLVSSYLDDHSSFQT